MIKRLLDYLPAVVFIILYFGSGKDIYLATWGILLASLFQITTSFLLWRKVDNLHLVVFAITLVFGGLTLALQNEKFIMWRPTIIYGVLAGALLVGEFFRRSFLQRMIEAISLKSLGYVPPYTRRDWRLFSLLFSGYFIFLAVLNIVVAYSFSEATWVNVKFFGFTALNLVFYPVLITVAYRRLPTEARAELIEKLNESSNNK
ncbi:MAG TPA: inner membrane-spanning protein YciB [Alcanivoracaceae bacterium]|nr:inner membrane-spanning protein YciB [Alcanivoracaceae bacterium]